MTSSSSLTSPLPLPSHFPRPTAHSLLNPTALPFPFTFSTKRRPNLSLNYSPPLLKVLCARDSRGKRTDPIYCNRLVNLLINRILKNGNKSLAFLIIYRALKRIQRNTGSNPLIVLRQAVREVTPDVALERRRVGGRTYQVPVELGIVKGRALAIRWLLKAARHGSDMAFKLSCEWMDPSVGSDNAVKQKEGFLSMAEDNRAFAHFR